MSRMEREGVRTLGPVLEGGFRDYRIRLGARRHLGDQECVKVQMF
jgi:hypothetical protein